MRQYIRHPASIPLHYNRSLPDNNEPPRLRDVSTGGLSFRTDEPLARGQRLTLRIDITDPPFTAEGEVVWCQPQDDHFLVGVSFGNHEAAFAVRMVEQVCHIEQYREQIRRTENRHLTTEEAAREWIERHARHFPSWEPNEDR